MALLFDPLADTQLVLSGSEELGLLLGVDAALEQLTSAAHHGKQQQHAIEALGRAYVVEAQKNLALLPRGCC